MQITIKETVEIPDGEYCVDYSKGNKLPPENACQFWEQSFSEITWSDGLGSPGTMTFNECTLFRTGLREIGPPPIKIEKCSRCLDETNNCRR